MEGRDSGGEYGVGMMYSCKVINSNVNPST